MVSLRSESVEVSAIAPNEMACQKPGGGLRSPAMRPVPSQSVELAIHGNPLLMMENQDAVDVRVNPQDAIEPESQWRRFRKGVWSPLVIKTAGACLGLTCLALFGAFSMQGSTPGVVVTADGTEWLAGEPAKNTHEQPLLSANHEPVARGEVIVEAPDPGLSAPIRSGAGPRADHPRSEVPALAQTAPPCSAESKKEPSGQGITADGRVILNSANEDEFTRLPGVGQRRAEQIVALRDRLGRFKRITDLLRIKGIGPKSLRKIKPMVVLDPPPPTEDLEPSSDLPSPSAQSPSQPSTHSPSQSSGTPAQPES